MTRALEGVDAYALDTEFHRERTYYPHLALMQIGWDEGATSVEVLVDTLAVDPAPLGGVLGGPGLCVMHAADQDLEILELNCGRVPMHLADTQVAGRFLGFGTASLDSLLRSVLGVKLPKADQLTDWTRRPLSSTAREYAAADVEHLLELDAALDGRLERVGRASWADEEVEELRSKPRTQRDPLTAWWRLKGSRKLRGRARGVAQEVAAWRERTAAAEDRPVRFVLPDLALLGIAGRPPHSVDELRAVRGLDGRHTRKSAATEILDAISRGEVLTGDELRLPPVTEGERAPKAVVSLALAWIAHRADELDLDPTLIATRDDVNALLGGGPDSRLRYGWRHEVAGATVQALAGGHLAVAPDGDGGLRLVEV
ncbi:MAG: HRDC domain-containing protein [Acidimicrobiia bacterium]|nr:HRDC domain-containing protein [Acidimicrobiia bacterium]